VTIIAVLTLELNRAHATAERKFTACAVPLSRYEVLEFMRQEIVKLHGSQWEHGATAFFYCEPDAIEEES
jgi:hypothetical protein